MVYDAIASKGNFNTGSSTALHIICKQAQVPRKRRLQKRRNCGCSKTFFTPRRREHCMGSSVMTSRWRMGVVMSTATIRTRYSYPQNSIAHACKRATTSTGREEHLIPRTRGQWYRRRAHRATRGGVRKRSSKRTSSKICII
jgi:hypothetical protein